MTAKYTKYFDNQPLQFRLRCSKALNLELGRFDAVIEVTEVAVSAFLKNAQSHSLINHYIKLKGQELNINVQHLKSEIFKARLSHSYIASTYQYFESFLYKWTNEYEALYNTRFEFGDSNENYFNKLLKQVQKHQSLYNENSENIENAIGRDIIEVINYYKAVRNKYSHLYQIKDEKIKRAFQEVNQFQSSLEEKFNLRSSKFEDCQFNDFLLFTRSIRFLNRRLSNYIKPKKDDVIVSYIKRLNRFKKIEQNKLRLNNSWKNFLIIEFGLRSEDADRIVSLA